MRNRGRKKVRKSAEDYLNVRRQQLHRREGKFMEMLKEKEPKTEEIEKNLRYAGGSTWLSEGQQTETD